jgi:hypothetical protein
MDETQVGPEKTLLLAAPHGLEEIVATFGDIYDYIRPGGQLDPRWQADHLASVELPFSLPPAWDPSKSINRMTCHKRMAETFVSVFGLVQKGGLQSKIKTFGGCFALRQQRTGARLSTHSWGIAIRSEFRNQRSRLVRRHGRRCD